MSCALRRVAAGTLLLSGAAVGVWGQHSRTAEPDSPQQHFDSAQTFQIAGDSEQAASEYREAIARGLQQLGNLRVSRGESAAAISLLVKATDITPKNVAARVDLAIAQFRVGDIESAKASAQTVLNKEPENVRALNLLAKVQFLQGNFQAAADALQTALQLQADFDTGYTLALADLELKKPVPAGMIFDDMLASSKPNASLQALVGIAYRETGYLDEAVSHLVKAVTLEPKSARAHSALGLTYFLKGAQEYPAARKQFLTAIDSGTEDYTAYYHLGMIATNEKSLTEAAKWFKKAVDAQPNDPDAHFRLGQVQFEAGNLEESVSEFRKSLASAPPEENVAITAHVHDLLGDALEKLGMHSDAERELALASKLREQQSNTSEKQRAPAEQPRSGQQELRSILLQTNSPPSSASPRDDAFVNRISSLLAEAYDNLGVIEARDGRYEDATNEFSEAAHWNANLAGLDRNWGMATFHAKRYGDAILPLERHLHKNPRDVAVRETLGTCYYMTDRLSEAAATFLPAIDALSGNRGVLYAAAVSLGKAGNTKDANKLLARMERENPNLPDVHLLLGEAHADLSEYDEALSEFSLALELNPKLAEANYYKGIVLFKKGQMDGAAQAFQAELGLNADSVGALYQLAVVRLAQRQTEEAIRLLTEVLEKSPSNSDARYQLGKAMLDKGDVKAAVENLEAAVHIEPKDYSYYQLSLAYQRDGRAQEAKKALQIYEKLKRKPPVGPPN